MRYILLFISAGFAFAQPAPDSLRVSSLVELSQKLVATDPEKALSLANEAYEHAGYNPFLKGAASLALGGFHQQKRNYETARTHYLEALKHYEKTGRSDDIAMIKMKIAENHGHLHQFHDALNYMRQARDILKKSPGSPQLKNVYQYLGSLHSWAFADFRARDTYDPAFSTDSALYYFDRAREAGSFTEIEQAGLNKNIGITYFHLSDKRAITHLNHTLEIHRHLKDTSEIVDILQFLGNAHTAIKDYPAAEASLNEANRLYQSLHSKDNFLLNKMAFAFVELYKATGAYKKAFEWLVTANKARDKRLLADREGAISRLTVQYETEKKEVLLKQRETELARQRETLNHERQLKWMMSGGLTLALGTLGIVFYLYRRNKQLVSLNAALVKEQNHRVKNNLQRLSNLMELQLRKISDEHTREILQESVGRVQAIGLLHRHLYNTTDLNVPIPFYLETLVGGLETVYNLPGLQIDYQVSPVALPSQQALALGLIVNEIATNAFKHAFSQAKSPQLRISFSRLGSVYRLQIKDNGHGLSPQSANRDSIGLQLVSLLARELKAAYRFSQDNGTVFELELPA